MSSPPTLDALRATIESIERHAPEGGLRPSAHAQRRRSRAGDGKAAVGWGRALSFGLDELDARFASGGLPFGAHEVTGPPGEPASALLFAALMLARRFQADPQAQALVVQEPCALQEGGGLYGPGLWALGLDPSRLVLVRAAEGGEALRITDEAVRSGAVAAVLTEAPRAAKKLDLAATQRLNLYGRQTSTLSILITPDLDATSAAMTRWRVRHAPSAAPKTYLGPPALEVDLVRNRLGPAGTFTVEWSSDHGAFRRPGHLVPALRPPVVSPPVHRSAGAPGRAGAAGGGGDAEERASAYGAR
jgi:protein ImuA